MVEAQNDAYSSAFLWEGGAFLSLGKEILKIKKLLLGLNFNIWEGYLGITSQKWVLSYPIVLLVFTFLISLGKVVAPSQGQQCSSDCFRKYFLQVIWSISW